MFKFLRETSPNFYLRERQLMSNLKKQKPENFKEKNPQDIFMRPRLVQERVLLEKLRNHADELVTPRPPTPPTPIPPTPEPPTKKIETVEPVIKSEPPSPQFTKTDSFLASVVQSAKDLNIDLTEVPIAKPSPKQPKE